MMKAALVVVLGLAACGGASKPAAEPISPPAPTETTDATRVAPPAESQPEPPDNDALAQAALAEQYDLGKKVYADKACDSCHGDRGEGGAKSPPVIGDGALPEQAPKTAKLRKGVAFKTAKDVLDFVQAKMPIKAPNTLSADEAAAVTAWMLSESKVDISRKLDASNASAVNLR